MYLLYNPPLARLSPSSAKSHLIYFIAKSEEILWQMVTGADTGDYQDI